MSREKRYTPGPWKTVDHYSDAMSVTDANGFEHVEAANTAILLDYAEKLGVGHWADSDDAKRYLPYEEQKANAHLIAAAPDLLEALEELSGWVDRHVRAVDVDSLLSQSNEAIAKAYGEARRFKP